MFKKHDEEKDSMKSQARSKLLEQIRSMARDAMSGDLEGMKKVTVASPSKEGLKEGLEKAEDLVESGPEKMLGDKEETEEMPYEEEKPSEEKEMESFVNEMSHEEMMKLQELLEKKMKERYDSEMA